MPCRQYGDNYEINTVPKANYTQFNADTLHAEIGRHLEQR